MKPRQSGVTFLELVVVIVVLGILSSIAFPLYFKAIEQGYETEGRQALARIRLAELRYHGDHALFTTRFADLDMPDPTLSSRYFTFQIDLATPNDFLAKAVRAPGGPSYQLTIDRNGAIIRY